MKKVILFVLLPIIMNAQTTNVGSRLLGNATANNDYFWVGLKGTNYQEPKSLGIGVEPQSNNLSFVRSLHFVTDGNYRMTVASDGNVGIGTVSPIHALHIARPNNSVSSFGLEQSNINMWRFGMAANSPDLRFSPASDSLTSSVFTIQQSGNVGVGTLNPLTKLYVDGDIGIPSFKKIKIGDYLNIQAHIKPQNEHDRALIAQGLVWNNDNNQYDLSANALYNRNGMILGNGGIKFFAHEGDIRNNPTWNQVELNSKVHLFVSNTGKVGVGTISPSYKFHVFGGSIKAVNYDNNSGISIGSAATDRPQIGFHVSDNSQRFKIELNNVNQANERLGVFTINGGAWSETEVFSIIKNGHVGIGTVNPSEKLDINGNIKIVNGSSFRFGEGFQYITNDATNSKLILGSNGGQNLVISNGNVGIGTTNPQSKFEVNNSIHVYNSEHLSNTWYKNIGLGLFSDTFYNIWEIKTKDNSGSGFLNLNNARWGGSLSITRAGQAGNRIAFDLFSSENQPNIFTIYNDLGNVVTNQLNSNGVSFFNGGNVGIGTNSPNAPLQFSNSIENKKIVLFEGANNDNQFYGFGINPSTLRYQTYTTLDDHVFFAGVSSTSSNELMRIKGNGSVGIGTTTIPSGYKLAVAGNVIAEKVKVKKSNIWPDFVFSPSYKLPNLTDVESFVKQNRHLPEIPSAAEIEKDGQDLGEMNRLLLKKVEELTLYLIELKKENVQQNIEIEKLKVLKR